MILTVLAASCTREQLAGPQKGVGNDTVIDLRVRSSEPVTKAFPDGEDLYNENVVYTLDYFIFNVNPVENPTTAALAHGRFAYEKAVTPVDEASSKAAGQIVDLKNVFDKDNNTGYVYVIANLPDKSMSPNNYFEFKDGDLQQVVGTATTKLNPDYTTLQAVEVAASFNTLTNGKFTAQKSFVMTGIKDFALTGTGPDEVTVDLSRIVSKLTLDMNVIKYLAQYTSDASAQSFYQNSWFPNVDKIQVYLNYANPEGLINGSYKGRTYQIGSYFSYNRNAFIPTIDPAGIYTEKQLSFDEEGNVIYEDGKPVYVDGTSYPAFSVTGSPFYSYPTTWHYSEATAPFLKIIIPWVSYKITDKDYENPTDETVRNKLIAAAAGFPENLIVDGKTVGERDVEHTSASEMTERGGHEYYYKISIPASLPDDPEMNAMQANYWYKLILNIAILGSDADDLPVELAGDYYIVDWSAPAESLGGELSAGRYLKVGSKTYEMFGNELEIPVKSSHTLTVTGVSNTYNIYTGNNPTGSLIQHATNVSGNNFTLTASGRDKVILKHTIASTLSTLEARDISPITYTFTIKHSDSDAYKETITVIQYPPIYARTVVTQNGNTVYLNGTGYLDDSATRVNNKQNQSLGNIGDSLNGTSPSKTIITIKTLANLNTTDYVNLGVGIPVIGDPRTSLAEAYPVNPLNRNQKWEPNHLDMPTNYKYAATNKSNVIAPEIMLASGYGGCSGNGTKVDWAHNVERCATYQEDGYPAGRWRLPTEAEVLFIAYIAKERKLIADPFFNTSHYYANSGRNYYNRGFDNGTTTNYSSRCVYDLWYWGDDKLDNPTGWGGYKTDFIHNN